MFEIMREDSLTFKLSNNGEFPALKVFIGIMSKLENDANKKGFKNPFSEEEKYFITNFIREVKNEANYRND